MVALLITASLGVRHLAKSFFNTGLLGAAGSSGDPVDDQFNRVSFLSHFEGSNNGVNNAFDDGSANNYTVTAAGNVTQGSFGPFARPDGEWGVSFDGDDYLSVAETGADEFTFGTGDFTIEGWINNQAVDGSRTIVSTAQGNDTQGIWFGIHQSKYYLIYNNSGSWSVIVHTGTPVVNAWTHFAVVRNGTSNVVYINGSSIGSTTETARDLTNTNNLIAIGGRASVAQYTISTMSNVRVVKGTAVYTGNFTPSTSKLTAITNTKLLTCQSNRFVDNSASPLTITPVGNPAVSAFGPFLTSAVYDPAVNGASAYFDGSGDALSTSSMTVNGTGNFTIEFWAYMTSTSGNRTFATFNDAGGATNILQYYVRNGEFKLYSDAGGVRTFSGGYASRNRWAFIHLSRSGSTATLKVNNVSYGTVSSSENLNGVLGIGAYVNQSIGDPYVGYMCDYRVSNTIRSSAIPTEPLGTDSNTKLLLNMADGQAIDSAAQNNLTLYGNAKISTGQAKFGDTSMVFDETGDYVTLPNNLFKPFGTGNFTIECFARFAVSPVGNGQGLFHLSSGYLNSAVRGPAAGANNSNGRWAIYHGTSVLVHGSLVPSQNTWYHVAYVRNSGVTKLYIDGTEILSVSDTTNYTDKYFLVGGWYSTSYLLNGYIDEFRISNMARYTSNFTAPTAAFADKGQ